VETTWLPEPPPEPARWPTAGWPTSTPEEQGMDAQTLAEMYAFIAERQINLHGLIVVRHGAIVTEAYFDPYQPDTPHEIASLTKSVIGTLVGIAASQGKIAAVDQPLVSFFPERAIAHLDARKQAIQLEHLLSLTSGLDCSDFTGKEAQMRQSADWVQFVLDLPMVSEPGKQWAYCSSVVHLLSALVESETGMSTRDFADRNLFTPLGFEPVGAGDWNQDPQGVVTGGNGLRLTPRDLAKYAYLYLHQGQWEAAQVVPQDWVRASLEPYIAIGTDPNYGGRPRSYGYLWSVFPEDGFYAAFGMGGQNIYVFPEQDLVVIMTAAVPSNVLLQTLIDEYIVPAIKANGPLPANPAAVTRLQAAAAAFAAPERPIPDLPDMGLEVSGDVYQVGENRFGWRQIALTFDPGSPVAYLKMDSLEPSPIGLDNRFRVMDQVNAPGLGLKGRWEQDNVFVLRAVLRSTFTEYDLKFTFEEDQLVITVSDVVWGGLSRIEGQR
jgi:CubicO group peptidase (beta-lactamase class C family)